MAPASRLFGGAGAGGGAVASGSLPALPLFSAQQASQSCEALHPAKLNEAQHLLSEMFTPTECATEKAQNLLSEMFTPSGSMTSVASTSGLATGGGGSGIWAPGDGGRFGWFGSWETAPEQQQRRSRRQRASEPPVQRASRRELAASSAAGGNLRRRHSGSQRSRASEDRYGRELSLPSAAAEGYDDCGAVALAPTQLALPLPQPLEPLNGRMPSFPDAHLRPTEDANERERTSPRVAARVPRGSSYSPAAVDHHQQQEVPGAEGEALQGDAFFCQLLAQALASPAAEATAMAPMIATATPALSLAMAPSSPLPAGSPSECAVVVASPDPLCAEWDAGFCLAEDGEASAAASGAPDAGSPGMALDLLGAPPLCELGAEENEPALYYFEPSAGSQDLSEVDSLSATFPCAVAPPPRAAATTTTAEEDGELGTALPEEGERPRQTHTEGGAPRPPGYA